MESIEELLLLLGAIIVLGLVLAYALPNVTSFAGTYKGQAIATIILNSFKLGSPVVSSGQATIYDNGYPVTLLVSITPYNPVSGAPVGNALSYLKSFVSGPNAIQLPTASGNVYYKISLYSSDGSVLYKTFYVNQYSSNYVKISNLLSYVKTYLDGTLLNLPQTNSTAYLYLPDGTYSLDIYSPYYFFKYNFGFPQNISETISLPTTFTQYTIPVYQMLPGKNLQPLPGAIISLNNNSATYKTSSSGTATILYTANAPVEINVTCPPNICGTGITNNYTSFYNVSPITKYESGTTTPIILYPLYRTIFNEQIICNGTAYPTPGTITILANPVNQTMNRYGTVNASGQFITYLYAGNYNVTGSTLSGLFNKTSVSITKQNQTFDVNFTYCVVHIPVNSIIFRETGLPTNTLWSVTYGSVYNQSTTSTITFNGLLKENYTFNIPNVTVGGITYIPSPSSGSSYPGKIIPVKFTELFYYVPITLTNSQSSATSSPFQQMITIDSANYAKYEAGGLQNVEFSTLPAGQGTVLNAWIESGASNTSTSTVYWVNLTNGIPASNSITIYMTFMPTNVMSSSGPTGEASQLSPTYGEYDDIANVMQPGLIYQIYYDSSGTCDNAGYQNNIYASSLENGVTISTCASFVSSTNPFITSQTGTTQNVDGTNQNNVIINYQEGYSGGSAYPNPPVSNNANSWIIKTIGWADLPDQQVTFYGMGDDGIAMGYSTSGGSSSGVYWLGGTSNPNNVYNGWRDQGATTYSGSLSPGTYRVEQDYFENGGGAYTAFWTNIPVNYYHASLPPNGVMPTVTIGSLQRT